MAEEETGFTFVDKRRTAADDAPTDPLETPAQTEPESQPTPQVDQSLDQVLDDDADQPNPTTYDLIGYCVSLLSTDAWQKLGLLADPRSGEAVADFVQAKAAIDAVTHLGAILEAAPADSCPEPMRRDLRTLLNDLRLNYVSRRGDSPLSRN